MDTIGTFLSILESLNRSVLDDAHWPATCGLIDETLGTRGNALVVGESCGHDVRVQFARFVFRGHRREDLEREYFEVYHPHDEALARVRALREGRLAHMSELYSEAERRTSLVYNEGLPRLRAQDSLRVRFDGADDLRAFWSFASPVASGGWHADQLQLVELLLPHIRHYIRIRHALAGAGALGAGLTGLLENRRIGVIQLDRCGCIVETNGCALSVLRGGKGLCDRDGVLHATVPADDDRLQRLLGEALGDAPGGGSMAVQRAFGRARLGLHISPCSSHQAGFGGRPAAVLVLVVDPATPPRLDPERVATMLDLTPTEGRVAALLAEGNSVRAIAAITRYRESYVRWLLKEVYRKHGLSGQVALVRRVLALNALP